jgi:hypothetical protein
MEAQNVDLEEHFSGIDWSLFLGENLGSNILGNDDGDDDDGDNDENDTNSISIINNSNYVANIHEHVSRTTSYQQQQNIYHNICHCAFITNNDLKVIYETFNGFFNKEKWTKQNVKVSATIFEWKRKLEQYLVSQTAILLQREPHFAFDDNYNVENPRSSAQKIIDYFTSSGLDEEKKYALSDKELFPTQLWNC